MGARHNHILAATHPDFAHAAVPREQSLCQHTIMTPQPLVLTHLEADVRFQAMSITKQLPARFYVGFPVTAPTLENNQAEIPVGTLCCIHTQHRAELTRSQYTTMKRLAFTASQLLQRKGRRLQQQMDIAVASELSDDLVLDPVNDTKQPPSDAEILERARSTHKSVDFVALAAGPELGGPWQRVEAADRFVVFRLQASKTVEAQPEVNVHDKSEPGPEVLCAGRLTASLEEVASILRPATGADHNAAMVGLYAKRFIFGSLERSIPCSTATKDCSADDVSSSVDEQLAVKTSSFLRTSLFASNEQWCYLDYFQRKQERDGFTIFQQALSPSEATPGRVIGAHARVEQLHQLNASYLVDLLPNRKGLRVVFNAWFDSSTSTSEESNQRSPSRNSNRRPSSASSSGSRSPLSDNSSDQKAQTRRLLALARGVTKLPELVRRRRFGVQVPADLAAIFVSNPRCPCCTRSLAPVKLSLAMAASAIASRSLAPLKMDTRHCYLCGYLVCVDCWTAEEMETMTGRVAAIVVCTRCRACVEACDYSEVCAPDQDDNHHRGPVRVVADRSPRSNTAPLLVDFLMASLTQ
ncbi:hypothetical protein BBJ28_00026437, partial [Nothophytophthora sp. Chile5]